MEFDEFHKWVHKELGINLLAYKPEQLNRRIKSLMGRIGVKTLEDYIKLIQSDDEQRQRFLDHITINVTEFYRNPTLYDELIEIIKDYIKAGNSPLKIWSAACSIGCEPYTLALIMKKVLPNVKNTIIATDIDNTILARAKKGEYTSEEVKNVPESELKQYFKMINNKYYIDDSIKSMVDFKKHDLICDSYDGNFDLILCRNVVIYFNNDIKKVIYQKFADSLKKGGLLFIGATESIYNYRECRFEKVSTFVYRKI